MKAANINAQLLYMLLESPTDFQRLDITYLCITLIHFKCESAQLPKHDT